MVESAVLFQVWLVRSNGKVTPRWLLYKNKRVGHLFIQDEEAKTLHRICRTARVTPTTHLVADVQPLMLYDVNLLWMNADQFALTGFERLDGGTGKPTDYAQTWICEAVDDFGT